MKKLFLMGSISFLVQSAFGGTDIGHRFKKVIWITFENASYSEVVAQPDFKKVASDGALFTNFSAESHPSQGNYIAMIAGSTLGVHSDGAVNLSDRHLGDLLESAHLGWRVYAEDFPSPCFTGKQSGNYVRKHNPFISFTNITSDSNRCARIVSDANYDADYGSGTIPEFTFYVPNLQNDGHDTGADFAGQWLTRKFGNELSHPEKLTDKLFVITFDENDGSGVNQIYTALVGGSVIPGSNNSQALNHAGLLRMIEDEFALGNLGRDDQKAAPITGIWQ